MRRSRGRVLAKYGAILNQRAIATEAGVDLWGSSQGAPVRLSLAEFFERSWTVLEPSTPLLSNWHLGTICEHLEFLFREWQARRGDRAHAMAFQNLLINVPPGSAKSRIVSVCFPAWIWTYEPSFRSIFLSANPRVALRDSMLCRDLIESRWYQDTFKPKWRLRGDQNAKSSFWNNAGGFRNAGGFFSRITGDRADGLFFDDPHDAEEVESETVRTSVTSRWDSAIRSRINDPRGSFRVGIMQRLHEDDLAGHVLRSREDQWHHLCIPQEYDPDVAKWVIGDGDPRTEDGELLWPERFDQDFCDRAKLNSYIWAGQHQQRPVPREGGLIKSAWLRRYDRPPKDGFVVQSWDTANKAKELNDPWCCTTWILHKEKFHLLHVLRKRMEYPEGKATAIALAVQWKPQAILIEDKASGQSLIQELRKDPQGQRFNIIGIQPHGDKVMRLVAETPKFEGGRVLLPRSAPWLAAYESEILTFPNGRHDDQVDSTSQYLKWQGMRSPVLPLFG